MPLDVEQLKGERDRLKESLRELEVEQRKAETDLKALRQREIRAKRELEALSVLIEMNDARKAGEPDEPAEPEG